MIKKSTFYLILLLLVINYTGSAHAQRIISGSKELPLEINLLLDSVQSIDPSNFEKILPLIMNIDLYARSMSKEDIFLIGKIETYKTLLKNYATPNKAPIDGTTINNLRAAIKNSKEKFIIWFFQALLKDSLDLVSNSTYKEFLLQKNAHKREYRKLEKKAELIQFWAAQINLENQDAITKELATKMIEVLTNIQNSFFLMANQTSMTPVVKSLKNENELKFFTIRSLSPVKEKTSTATGQKNIKDISVPASPALPLDLPKPTLENWLEEENAPDSLQNFPKPDNDADWLQDF